MPNVRNENSTLSVTIDFFERDAFGDRSKIGGTRNKVALLTRSSAYHQALGYHFGQRYDLYDYGICRKWKFILFSEYQKRFRGG